MVEAGKPAYYGPDGAVDPEVAALLEQAEPGRPAAAEVRDRVLAALAEEARLMLDEGVVAAAQDLDLAMITGAGFSFWNGGLTMLLDARHLGGVNGRGSTDPPPADVHPSRGQLSGRFDQACLATLV